MSYRFTLAALTAALTLTGCAKHQKAGTPDDFFKGPSQINVSHVMTRADDGSSIFLTVDGNDAGPLLPGENTEVQIPAGKHQVGGYAQTLLGLGRVTIQSIEVTINPGEITQLAYSVTRDKPVFVKEGVTKLPAKPVPAPEPARQEAAPVENNQSAAVATPSTESATATDNSATAQAATQSTSPTSVTAETTPAVQSAPATTATTQSTATSQPATTTTESAASSQSATTGKSTEETPVSQPEATQSTSAETTQNASEETSSGTSQTPTEQSATSPLATAQTSGSSE